MKSVVVSETCGSILITFEKAITDRLVYIVITAQQPANKLQLNR